MKPTKPNLITGPQLEALTGLTTRRIQQLAAAGKIPPAIDGRWQMTETIKALFAYFRTLREPDELDAARLDKIQTETALLKADLALREGELIPVAEILETMQRGLLAMVATVMSMTDLKIEHREKIIGQLRESGELAKNVTRKKT
jgi:hypothetical protein